MKTWEKTRVQFLYLHKSGAYYARVYAGGKEHWRNLETTHYQVAKSKLPKAVEEIQVAAGRNPNFGKSRLTFGGAAAEFMRKPSRRPDAKSSTLQYWQEIIGAIFASWPSLAETDVRKITPEECHEWAKAFAAKYSATRYNAALAAMKNIFKIAIREGARYDNPATDERISRRKVKAKPLELPSIEIFGKFTNEIENAGGRFSSACADFVRGLAFTGMRRGEATWLQWRHLDFIRERIRIVGHPNDSTKSGEERTIPMIPAARKLFSRMKSRRRQESSESLVFSVNEAQKAMDRAARRVGMERITHHDLRHLFATTCIESGVDIPTLSRWLGHKDGGVLAMKTYGHLRDEHSSAQAQKVSFVLTLTEHVS